jgi:hypothetical protein
MLSLCGSSPRIVKIFDDKRMFDMAKVIVYGVCNGTQSLTSKKTGKEYKVTSFVDFDNFQTFQVFGDLGLSKDVTPREYQLEGTVLSLSSVKLLSGSAKK